MFGQYFYHKSIRTYTSMFGTLFNNIQIVRGTDAQKIKVPLTYASKDSYLARFREDENQTRHIQLVLPALCFQLTAATYDPMRKLNTLNRLVKDTTGNENFRGVYCPVPYNFDYSLELLAMHVDDSLQVVEQIAPYFTPTFTVAVNDIPELGLISDTVVMLNGMSPTEDFEGGFAETKRTITWTMDFTIKGYLYGPIKDEAIILKTNLNIFEGF